MTSRTLPFEVKEAIVNVCGRAFWYKHTLFNMLGSAGIPEAMFTQYEHEAKFVIARNVLRDLEQMGDDGFLLQRRLLTGLTRLRGLPDNGVEDRDAAADALRALKDVVVKHDLQFTEERDEAKRRQRAAQVSSGERDTKLGLLMSVFGEMSGSENRQARGYDLERLLSELFALFGINYRPPYRIRGQQIDGYYHFRGFDYLVEARWRQDRATFGDLTTFKGKVDTKIESTRGLFLSVSGFMPGAEDQLRQAGPTNMILMDGSDLAILFEGRIDLPQALNVKADAAAQEGRLFFPLAQILTDSVTVPTRNNIGE